MLLLLFGILLTLVPVTMAIVHTRHKIHSSLVIIGCGLTVIGPLLLAICCIFYMGNLSDRAEIEATYYNNIQNYQVAITETTTYLSQDEFISQLIAGSIEKTNLGEQVATRIAEWRNTVNNYNIQYNKYKAMSDNVFTGLFYPKLPDDLRMLTISATNLSQ